MCKDAERKKESEEWIEGTLNTDGLKYNIENFVTIIRRKNGGIRITHDINNEGNIYQLLYEFGFVKQDWIINEYIN